MSACGPVYNAKILGADQIVTVEPDHIKVYSFPYFCSQDANFGPRLFWQPILSRMAKARTAQSLSQSVAECCIIIGQGFSNATEDVLGHGVFNSDGTPVICFLSRFAQKLLQAIFGSEQRTLQQDAIMS